MQTHADIGSGISTLQPVDSRDGPPTGTGLRRGRAPLRYVVVLLAAAMGSTCAEGHMSCHLDRVLASAQMFEELCELLAYVALLLVQHVVFMHQMPVKREPGVVHTATVAPEEVG